MTPARRAALLRVLEDWLCRWRGHQWQKDDPNWARRYCMRCGRKSLLMRNVVTGEFTWKTMETGTGLAAARREKDAAT